MLVCLRAQLYFRLREVVRMMCPELRVSSCQFAILGGRKLVSSYLDL